MFPLFERQSFRQNIAAVFYQSEVNEKLNSLLESKIENFELKLPNFLQKLNIREKQALLNDLFVLRAYDFVNDKLFRVALKMPRPLDEIHQRATEVGFLMENYSGLREVYPFLMLLHRKGILRPNRPLSLKLKSALEYLQNNYENNYEHQFLLYMILKNQFTDESLIISALTTSQPYLLCRIFDIFENVLTKKMAYQFFKHVKNWESQSLDFLHHQLKLLGAMDFFKEQNHRLLMESGLFQWNKRKILLQQIELFHFFNPEKTHFENILSMKNPCMVAHFLLIKAPQIIQNCKNLNQEQNSEYLDNMLEIFFKLITLYPDTLTEDKLNDSLNAALKFKSVLGDLNHPALTKLSAHMWGKLVSIAKIHQDGIDEKVRCFIDNIDLGRRFMNYEINTFTARCSPTSVAEPISPRWISSELEDPSSLKRSWPK